MQIVKAYYILGQKPEDGGGFLKKAIENTEKTPFNQLASTKYPEVDLPTVGSMVAIWADRPSAELKDFFFFVLSAWSICPDSNHTTNSR